MRRILRLLGVTAAFATTACGGDRISHYQYPHYDGSYLGDAAKNGPIPLRVYGEPRPGTGELAAAAAIADAMAGANIGTPVTYAPTEQLPADGYVVIVQFGGGSPPGVLCRKGGNGGVGADYAAAFCLDDTSLSHLAGAVGDSDIRSPGFRQAMSTAASVLLPPQNPNYHDCDESACN